MRNPLRAIGTVLLCSILLGLAPIAWAEDAPAKPQLYLIYQAAVAPAHVAQYEAALHEWLDQLKAYEVSPSEINFKTVTGPEIGYTYVLPIDGFAGMDNVHNAFMAAREKVGAEKWDALEEKMDGLSDHFNAFHVAHRADLSYAPENPRLGPNEGSYVIYRFYYPLPGKAKELEEIARKYVALHKSKGTTGGWNVYQAITGEDLPVYVVARVGTSFADCQAAMEKDSAAVGEAGERLGKSAMALLRRIEEKQGVLRPDLCYPAQSGSGTNEE